MFFHLTSAMRDYEEVVEPALLLLGSSIYDLKIKSVDGIVAASNWDSINADSRVAARTEQHEHRT